MHAMRLIGMLGVASLMGCGSDHQSRLEQVDDPGDHNSTLDPVDVPQQCSVSANCEDGDRCSENRCVAFECVAIPVPFEECCQAVTLFEEDFDGALDSGIELTALNAEAGWNVVDAKSTSPPNALYFGDPVARTYDKGVQVAGSVTLPLIALPKDKEAVLSMRLYAAIEPTLEYDLFWVEADIFRDTTSVETVRLFSKRDLPFTAFQDFALVDVPLKALAGETVQLRLRFDTLDGTSNAFEGLYLDDLRIQATCPIPPPCAGDEDCASGDLCVVSACSELGCVSTDVCSEEPNPCEVAGSPSDCCVADADCDDADPRTLDVCDGAGCAHHPNPDACLDDAGCDDGEACTVDHCDGASATCSHTGMIGEGCCLPGDSAIADFDSESLQGIYVTDNFETGLFWRTDKTRASSGEFSLYCGDPVTQSYAHDTRIKSSATTRPLTVPKGGTTVLGFDLFKATRTARNWDVFAVFALRGGALFPLWSSRSLVDGTTGGNWQHVEVSLAAYAGSDIQIRFVFDSVDAPAGAFEGTYLDTIGITTRCQ